MAASRRIGAKVPMPLMRIVPPVRGRHRTRGRFQRFSDGRRVALGTLRRTGLVSHHLGSTRYVVAESLLVSAVGGSRVGFSSGGDRCEPRYREANLNRKNTPSTDSAATMRSWPGA